MSAEDPETCVASERKAPHEQARGRLLRLHGPRFLFALFSAACFACTALVIFSLSFRPPASLARPSFSFRYLFGLLFQQIACLALLAYAFCSFVRSWPVLGLSWPLLGRSWALLGRSWPLWGSSWAALGRSWEALGRLLAALGRSWGDLGTTCENHQKIDAKNDRFWLPKAPPNGTKIALTSVQK